MSSSWSSVVVVALGCRRHHCRCDRRHYRSHRCRGCAHRGRRCRRRRRRRRHHRRRLTKSLLEKTLTKSRRSMNSKSKLGPSRVDLLAVIIYFAEVCRNNQQMGLQVTGCRCNPSALTAIGSICWRTDTLAYFVIPFAGCFDMHRLIFVTEP